MADLRAEYEAARLADFNGDEAPPHSDDDAPADVVAPFPMLSLAELGRAVDAAPPPLFIVRGVLVDADYGVIGAPKKFGKTFLVADLSINVAAGGKVLGTWPVDHPGKVLLFAGEGGRRKIMRRARAVAAFYGHDVDLLPVYVYERAPKLAVAVEVERLRVTVDLHRPRLVIVDPAYLALSGADTRNLVVMGVLLERIQIICQDHGAALVLTHHWNKTGTGSSADRFTGAGFAEWGRLLVSGDVTSRRTEADTKRSSVLCRLEIVGDEIADTTVTFRHVWTDNPDDLSSPMHYEIHLVADDGLPDPDDLDLPAGVKLKPAALRVLLVLRVARPRWLNAKDIGDTTAGAGHPLKANTIYEACKVLVGHDLADVSGGGATGITQTWTAK